MSKSDFTNSNNLEFFSRDGISLEFFKDGKTHQFTENCIAEIKILRHDLQNHPEFIKEMKRVEIHSEFEQVKRFGICFFGDLNFSPDFTNGIRADIEFFACDNYEHCKLKHKPCRNLVAKLGIITRTEIEIIKAVVLELTDKQIGYKLFKSTSTVKSHIRNILFKTDRVTKVGIVVFGIKSGIIDTTEL